MKLCCWMTILSVLAVHASAFLNIKDVESKLDEKRREFRKTFASGDNAELAQLYTSDTTVLPSKHHVISGRASLMNYVEKLHDSGIKQLSLTPHQLLPLAQGDCGVVPQALEYSYLAERGEYQFFGKGGLYMEHGDYMLVWRVYESGDAKIHWDIFNEVFKA